MSVETERRPARAAPRPRPRSGFELWAWLFMRLSGIVLLFLAVGHVLIMHVVDEGVQRVNFDFVVDRWASPFWRTWDWMLLSLGLLHGINGTRVVIQDHVRSPGWRLTWNSIFVIVGFALFVLGSVIVFTFDAAEFGFS